MKRKEGKNNESLIKKWIEDWKRNGIINKIIRIEVEIEDIEGIREEIDIDERRIEEKRGKERKIKSWRNEEDFEIVEKWRMKIERKRKKEIGIKDELMKLIKEKGGKEIKVRIIKDNERKEEIGEEKNYGFGR